jgi:hypothetical protein
MTWKEKVSKSNVLLFQLQASVLGTKEKEFGLWLTPNAMDSLPPRSEEALKKQYQKNRKGRTTHSTLREQVLYPPPKQMWPTPRASGEENPETLIKRKGIKKASQHNLTAAVKMQEMYPTPTSRDWKDTMGTVPPSRQQKSKQTLGQRISHNNLDNKKLGGKLNPTFVEFLMGYPMNWTKIEPTE